MLLPLGLGLAGALLWCLLFPLTSGVAWAFKGNPLPPAHARSVFHLYSSPDTSPGVVISQLYASGGEHGALFRYDFIELFNRGTTSVNLSGWSVQYAAGRNSTWQSLSLRGSLAPGQFYLVRLADNGQEGSALPEADVTGSLALQATAGRVALVRATELLPFQLNCPLDPQTSSKVVDLIGYGDPVLCAEGAAAPAPGLNTALTRRLAGCQDTEQNSLDFVLSAPQPRNTSTPLQPCNGSTAPQANLVISTVTSSGPATQTSGASTARLARDWQRSDRAAVQTQTSAASVTAQGLFTVIVTVRNIGPATATNVLVSNTAPEGFSNITAEQNASVTGLTATWPVIPTLTSGASVTFRMTATAPALSASGTNVARCTTDTFDPALENNRSATPVKVLAGAYIEAEDIRINFAAATSFCQTSFSAEVQFTNTGFTAQPNNTDPELIVNLPPLVKASSCFATKGSCRYESGSQRLRWDGSLEVNETVTVTLGVQFAASNLPPPTTFCLDVNVMYDGDNDGHNESVAQAEGCDQYECGDPSLPELALSAGSEASAQKTGSVLIFNLYSSNAADPAREDTRLSLTNTHTSSPATVHLFFVNGDSCEVADVYLCLTANQTTTFFASEIDPGVTGYLIAVATDAVLGCPVNFNYLLGAADVKLASLHAASLSAESLAAVADQPVTCAPTDLVATVRFDGQRYNRLPRALALASLASLADGNATLLVLNRINGDLSARVSPLGKFFGLLYDDVERSFSFTAEGGCQFRQILSEQFPRTAPRYAQVIPSGHTGWLRLWAGEDYGLLGAALNFNPNVAGSALAYLGGRNLHKLTFTASVSLTVPLYPPHCQ